MTPPAPPPDDAADEADEADATGPDVHPAVFASNWRTVLAVDAAMGVAVAVVGVALALWWNPVVGGFVGSLGAVYVLLVGRRAREWRDLRRDAGL